MVAWEDSGSQLCWMQLFNVWVEPLVEVTVHLSDQRDAVVIQVWYTCFHGCISLSKRLPSQELDCALKIVFLLQT